MEKIKKLTKKDKFTMLLNMKEVKANQELVDFIKNEIALVDKKALNNKNSKTKDANGQIKDLIMKTMAGGKPMTVTEILNTYSSITTAVGGSNQKLTALLTQLVKEEKAINTKDKKKSLYSIV